MMAEDRPWSSLLQAIFLELSVQGPLSDAQKLGGLLAIAAGHGQGLPHGFLLEAVQADSSQRAHVQMLVIITDPHVVGHFTHIDLLTGRHHDHALNDVEQLADVTRPVVGHETEHGRFGEVRLRLALLTGELARSMIDQQRDVLATFTQWWQMDLGAVDAEVEILAELLLLDLMTKVTIGRTHEPDIRVMFVVGTEPDDFTRLQHAKELGLHGQRHVTDLIQEERSLVGVFEDAFAILLGTREGALHMTEQLVLEQTFALPGAVERDIPVVDPLGLVVHGAGDQFLAGARLARDQDGDHAGADLLDGLNHLSHRRRVADDALEAEGGIDLALQTGVVITKVHRFNRTIDQIPEDLQIKWLLDEVIGPTLKRRLGGTDVAMSRDHDHFRISLMFTGISKYLQTRVRLLHAQVGHDHVEAAQPKLLFGRLDAIDDGADMAQPTQTLGHDLGVVDFILDD